MCRQYYSGNVVAGYQDGAPARSLDQELEVCELDEIRLVHLRLKSKIFESQGLVRSGLRLATDDGIRVEPKSIRRVAWCVAQT